MRTLTLIMTITLLAGAAVSGDPDDILTGRPDGTYGFAYPVRDGVYGDGSRRIIHVEDADDRDEGWGDDMDAGPARIEVRLRDGTVRDLDLRVGGSARGAGRGVTDLGEIDPGVAAAWLLEVAAVAPEGVAEDALHGAALARDAVIWPALLELAKDRDRPDEIREEVLFWLAVDAADAAVGPLGDLIDDDDESVELREHAVFAISQLPEETAFPLLLDIARAHKHPEVQRAAFIWLAEYDDPQVLDLFENILFGR